MYATVVKKIMDQGVILHNIIRFKLQCMGTTPYSTAKNEIHPVARVLTNP